LGFKYDEELRFYLSSDLYYYPSLNIEYPRTPAQYIIADKAFTTNISNGLSVLEGVFNDYNEFIIECDDSKQIIEKIG